jgi:hypothetical protein
MVACDIANDSLAGTSGDQILESWSREYDLFDADIMYEEEVLIQAFKTCYGCLYETDDDAAA